MNPYAKAKREQYQVLRQQIETVQTRAAEHKNDDGTAGRNLTEQELEHVRSWGDDARKLFAEIETLAELEDRDAKVAELAGSLMAGGNGSGGAGWRSVGSGEPDPYGDESASMVPALMPSRKQVAEVIRMLSGEDQRPMTFATAPRDPQAQHNRATVTLTGDVGQPTLPLTTFEPVEPRRISTAAGLTREDVAGTSGVAFPVFLAGAAAQTAEGVAKQEYDNINPGTALPKVISIWTEFTRQAMWAHGTFEQRLRQKLAGLVAAQEDILLQTKVAATAGIQTQAFVAGNQAGQVLIGAAKVQAAVNVPPDVALVNPADIALLFGAGLANTPPGELAALDLNLFGMRVYPTNAQTAGFVLLGAWRACSKFVVGVPPFYQVDPFTGMKTNKVTTLLEEAVDIAVEEPAGFISIDIITP